MNNIDAHLRRMDLVRQAKAHKLAPSSVKNACSLILAGFSFDDAVKAAAVVLKESNITLYQDTRVSTLEGSIRKILNNRGIY